MPDLFIIAGPNGAGKTTVSSMLPGILHCFHFLNADAMEAGVLADRPKDAATAAGRKMIQSIKKLTKEKRTFAFETTLATKTYTRLIKNAQLAGFKVTLIYLWLDSAEIAERRIKERVQNGGKDLYEDLMEKKHDQSIPHFFNLYASICDTWILVDNSEGDLAVIARGEARKAIEIKDAGLWYTIQTQLNELTT